MAGLRGAGRGEPGIDGLDALARALGMTLRVSRVLISIFDERGQRLVGSFGLPDDKVGPMAVREVSPLARNVSMSARPVILHDARRRKGAGGVGLAALGVVAYAGMPVMAGDVAVGVVAAIDANVRAWSERDIEILRAFSEVIGSILVRESERRESDPLELALHDELTGLFNRRGFYAVANGQLAIARRKHLAGVVLFVDVDGLKERNDRDGHAAGDELLRAAAGVLRATFRDADTIGRVGGDEFVVFSIDAAGRDIEKVLARLADELGRFNQALDSKVRLRWSVGSNPFEAESSTSLDTLIVEADRRMYVAKREQRSASRRQPLPGSLEG